MKNKFAIGVVIALILMVLFMGCIGLQKIKLVGKWEEVNGLFTVRFFRDGTLVIYTPILDSSHEVKYKLIDRDELRIDLEASILGEPFTGSEIVKISISGDELTILYGEEETYVFRKVE
jgi:hypothetical protein